MKPVRILLSFLTIALLLSAAMLPAQDEGGPPSLHPRYRIETSLGAIIVELDAEKAPISTLNFDQYAADNFYDGTTFHRVIDKFMIQGGGFDASYNQKKTGLHPPIRNEWENGLKNQRGTIAMARLPRKAASATSQFFINVADNTSLDVPADGAGYAVFGKVINGMDVADQIAALPKKHHPAFSSATGAEVPETPVLIKDVKVLTPLDAQKVKSSVDAGTDAAAKAEAVITANDPAEFIRKIESQYGKKITTTPSGLSYIITETGNPQDRPSTATIAAVSYTGRLLSGKEVDRQKRVELRLSNEFRQLQGLKEGILLMRKGDRAVLVIPPNLAYGERGLTNVIPKDATLVFNVELKDWK